VKKAILSWIDIVILTFIFTGYTMGIMENPEWKTTTLPAVGTLRWRYKTGDRIFSSPAMGICGTIYVGSYDHYIYSIYGGSSGIANTPWPMFHHDLRHTGRK